jgi:uncharacterized repeat protein (TIGR01451 family)
MQLGIEELENRLVPVTFTVNSLADVANLPDGVVTLRSAILAANNDQNQYVNARDVINFSVTGTIALTSALPTINHEVVAIQGPGASSLTILDDGQNDTMLTLGTTAWVSVSGLTLDGSRGYGSNGITVNAASTLLVQDAVIRNTRNVAGSGGAIANLGGYVTVTRTSLLQNLALRSGGAIYSTTSGGFGWVVVQDSTFVDNASAQGSGGALALDGGSQATVTDSTFTENSATFNGSAIAVLGSTGTNGSLTLSSSTVFDNSLSTDVGAGLYVDPSATAIVRDTIVAGNQVSGGAESDVLGNLDPTSSFNLIGDGTGLTGISNGFGGNQIGTDAQPIDPRLGPLANNGGPTETLALLPGSPAIDPGPAQLPAPQQPTNPSTPTQPGQPGKPTAPAQPPNLAPPASNGPATDQRGFPRVVGPAQDIGAVEYQYDLAAGATAPTSVVAGGTITYTLTATKNGPDMAPSLTLTDTLPAGTTFVSFTGSAGATVSTPGVGQTGTVTATIAQPVPPGAIAAFNLVVQVAPTTTPGTISNSVTFGPTTDDTNAANNTAVSTTTVFAPLTLTQAALPDGTYGSVYSQTLTATGGTGGPYTFTITSGSLPGGLVLAPNGALTGAPTAAGAFTFLVQASDSAGFTGSQSYTLTIDKATLTVTANNAARIYGVPNPTFTYTIGGFVNGDTAGVVSGSPNLSTTATPGSAPGSYDINVDITPLSAANYTFQPARGTLTVTPAPLSATGVSFSATAGAPFSGTVATFTNADPFGSATSYTALISWGDGSTSAGVISGTGSTWTVNGSHTYTDPVNETVQVTIRHNLGYTTTASTTGTATVTNLGQGVQHGQAAGIGFWHNKNGQALIQSFNGGSTSTVLANWLAATLPNLYGTGAGANNLTGMTNAQLAAFYQTQFGLPGAKVEAQVLATALNVFATTMSLGGTAGAAYGFTVSATGLGAQSYSVGSDGAAFGVANSSTLNVYELLQAVNQRAVNGLLYGGNTTLRQEAADLFNALNSAGGI